MIVIDDQFGDPGDPSSEFQFVQSMVGKGATLLVTNGDFINKL